MPANDPAAFISYSRDDSEFALRLAEDLKAAGANVWLDQLDIEPGQEWDSAIESALIQSPRMLLILSPSSVKSGNVRNEISFALDERKIIIPVLYRDCTVPLQLRRVQHVDFRADYARGLKALLKSLGVQPSRPDFPAPSEASQEVSSFAPQTDQHQELSKRQKEAERNSAEVEEARRRTATQSPVPETADSKTKSEDGGRHEAQYDQGQRLRFHGLPNLLSQAPTWARVAFVVGLATVGVLYFAFSRRPHGAQTGDAQKQPLQTEASTPQSTRQQLGWAAGDNGTILHTEDGGTWQKQASGTNARLNSLAFVTPQSGWAVGDKGTILRTEDGGDTWKSQASGTAETLEFVSFVTSQSGWVVGFNGTILHTEDGGGTWRRQDSGTDADLLSVAFVTPQSGWTAGDKGSILHTKDGGGVWKKQASRTDKLLVSVTLVTPQSGWAAGDEGTILHTGNSGATWKRQVSGTDENLYSVSFLTPQSGWAIGYASTILHTEDGGRTWNGQASGTDVFLRSVASLSPKSGWVVGRTGTILHTEDGGSNWKKQDSGTDVDLNSVAFVNSR